MNIFKLRNSQHTVFPQNLKFLFLLMFLLPFINHNAWSLSNKLGEGSGSDLCESIYSARMKWANDNGIVYKKEEDPYTFTCLTGSWKPFDIQLYTREQMLTWEQFVTTVNEMKQKELPKLAEQWPSVSTEMLPLLFYTGVVGHLYPVGGIMLSDGRIFEPRSVRTWYSGNGQKPTIITPAEAYIHAAAGECNDFATVLYMLLKANGYNAYHVGPDPSHINIEVDLKYKKITLDSTYLFVADASMDELFPTKIMGSKRLNTIYILPNGGTNINARQFRQRRLPRNIEYYSFFGFKKRISKDYSHWDQYEEFKKINGILNDPVNEFSSCYLDDRNPNACFPYY